MKLLYSSKESNVWTMLFAGLLGEYSLLACLLVFPSSHLHKYHIPFQTLPYKRILAPSRFERELATSQRPERSPLIAHLKVSVHTQYI